jgi:glucose-1-phosphate thymidylyltransferase
MKKLRVEVLGRGFAWLDTGTHRSLLEAASFVETIEKRQGFKIACLEEIAYVNKWLTTDQLLQVSKNMGNHSYAKYLLNIANEAKNS